MKRRERKRGNAVTSMAGLKPCPTKRRRGGAKMPPQPRVEHEPRALVFGVRWTPPESETGPGSQFLVGTANCDEPLRRLRNVLRSRRSLSTRPQIDDSKSGYKRYWPEVRVSTPTRKSALPQFIRRANSVRQLAG